MTSGGGGGNNVTLSEPLLSVSLLALISFYGVVLVAGVVGNSVVAVIMCTQQTPRMRNNLMLSVCVSDLLVCALSGPLTAATNTYHGIWVLGHAACKITAFLQMLPAAASLFSLCALSVDRYASVSHARALSQLRPRRHALLLSMMGVWGGAVLSSCPAVLAVESSAITGQCEEVWPSPAVRIAFRISHLVLVYLVPCLAVAFCHFAVGHKLCEVSLTAAAARGQLPLPMPILRRPKHVIIVASVANDAPSKVIPYHRGACDEDNSSDNEALALQIRADLDDLRPHSKLRRQEAMKLSRLQRATRSERSIVRANRRLRRPPPPRPPLIKTASRQSLHSRRHLANMLAFQAVRVVVTGITTSHPTMAPSAQPSSSSKEVAHNALSGFVKPDKKVSVIFLTPARLRLTIVNTLPWILKPVAVLAICWLPYVGCAMCLELDAPGTATVRAVMPFFLLMGHAHSAINPALYWLLNRQSLQFPSGCASQLSGKLRFFRLPDFHRHNANAAGHAPPSSTNEAALGPFNPRYVNYRPRQQPFHTSQFLG